MIHWIQMTLNNLGVYTMWVYTMVVYSFGLPTPELGSYILWTLGSTLWGVYTQDVYSLGLPSLHLELYILWVYTLVCLDWWNLHSGVYPIGLTILNLELYTHLTRIHYVRSRFWGVYILGIQIWTCKTMIYVCLDSVIPRATDFGSGCACIYMPLKRQCRGPLNSITFA
jgi:hypothetical protein